MMTGRIRVSTNKILNNETQYEYLPTFSKRFAIRQISTHSIEQGHVAFTEEQALDMERRSEDSKIEMIPLGKKRFVVEVK